MSESPNHTPASTRDVVLSALVPVYGALAGLIAISKGQSQRGRAMATISTVNFIVIFEVGHWLLK
jgi:hypothetical protein